MSITLNSGSGGATLGTDTVSGAPNVDYQIVKIGYSVSGAAPTQVSTTNPLPVTLANTGANSTALKVDGSAVTQPISGTVTSNIGTTNGLALDASVSGLSLAQASTTSGQKGVLLQGAVTTAAPSYTTAQTSPLSLTTTGSLRVDGSAVAQPASQSGTWNITNISGTVSLPTGAATAAKQPALGTAGTASSDVITVQGIASMTAIKVDGSGVTQPVSGTFWQATQPVSQSGTWTVQPGNTANTTPWLVSEVPTAGQGASVNAQLQAVSGVVNANIKGSAGTIYSIDITNNNSTPVFARLYDKATAPATTDTPIWRGIVPGNSGAAGMVRVFSQGLKTVSGIGIRITGAIADNDATSVNNVAANVEYA